MRFLPTMFHGFVDYVVGLGVIGLPFFLGFNEVPRTVLIVLGIAVLLYSLLTDYELGAVRFLRIRFHLLLDGLFGAAMLVSPWLFDFPVDSRWPVYVIGVLALVLTMTTQIRAEGTAASN
ncbi:SPW repeat domain-containing protein [Agrobacterium rosae]